MTRNRIDEKPFVHRPGEGITERLVEVVMKSGDEMLFDGEFIHLRDGMLLVLDEPETPANKAAPIRICHLVGAIPIEDVKLIHIVPNPRAQQGEDDE